MTAHDHDPRAVEALGRELEADCLDHCCYGKKLVNPEKVARMILSREAALKERSDDDSERTRERDEARKWGGQQFTEVASLLPWAHFGAWAFEEFWHDSEPGDIDGTDAQEKAVECGLLARTSTCDAGATHAEECEWQPGMPDEECCCYSPCRAPLATLAPESAANEGGKG